MDYDTTARRTSANIFGNEKLAEIVLMLNAEPGALLAADIARQTGFGHSLVRDVLVRLSKTSAIRALPKTGNPRGPAYYEKDSQSPLWAPLVQLAQAVAASDQPVEPAEQDL